MTLLYDILLHTISCAITLYINYSFFAAFFKRKGGRKALLVYFATCEILLSAAMVFFFDVVPVRLIISVAAVIVMSLLFRMEWYYHVLMPIALYALLAICENLTGALVSSLFSIDLKTAVSGKFFVIGLFLSKLVSFLAVKLLTLTRYRFTRMKPSKGMIAVVIVPIATMSVILLQYGFIVNSDEISTPVSILSVLCYSALVLSNFLVFDWINRIAREVERDTRLSAANELIAVQKERYDSMLEHNKSIQKLKHDQKNLYIGLLSELENENYEAVKEAIKNELNILSNKSYDHTDGVVGAMIEHKADLARAKGIELEHNLSGMGRINVPPVDLSIILGNALDNAIEATEKVTDLEKRVILSIKNTKGTVVITINNPTAEDVDVESLTSTKNDPSSHGFGILSIKSIAERYCGEVIFSYSDHQFTTHIVMRNTANNETT